MSEKELQSQIDRELAMRDLTMEQIQQGVSALATKLEHIDAPELTNELILQKSRLARLNKAISAKTLTETEAKVERTRIAYSLAELTQIAEAGDFLENCGVPQPSV